MSFLQGLNGVLEILQAAEQGRPANGTNFLGCGGVEGVARRSAVSGALQRSGPEYGSG